MSQKIEFQVKRLYEPAIPSVPTEKREEFYADYLQVVAERNELNYQLNQSKKIAKALELSLTNATKNADKQQKSLYAVQQALVKLERELSGYKTKNEVGEKNAPTLNDRIWGAGAPTFGSIHGPTETAKQSLVLAKKMLVELNNELKNIESLIELIVQDLDEIGAPSIHGVD